MELLHYLDSPLYPADKCAVRKAVSALSSCTPSIFTQPLVARHAPVSCDLRCKFAREKKPRAMPTSADKQSEHDTRAVWFFFGELMRLTGGKVGQGAGSRFVHRMWGHLSEITFSFRERWVGREDGSDPRSPLTSSRLLKGALQRAEKTRHGRRRPRRRRATINFQ